MTDERNFMRERTRWIVVVIFSLAMAWMESAAVTYLRSLVGRIDPYQARPLPISIGLGQAEVVREAATLIMLFTVGWLAGRSWRSRLGYALIAFGMWDIFYYVFLAVISGWPHSIFDWDVLFLIPLPWWGPVIAPALIALMMIIGGTLVSQHDQPDRPIRPNRSAWLMNLSGVIVALYVFMADAIRAVGGGLDSIRSVLPTSFNWPLFIIALVLMAAPIIDMSRKIWGKRNENLKLEVGS
jgi:hypothetical protein